MRRYAALELQVRTHALVPAIRLLAAGFESVPLAIIAFSYLARESHSDGVYVVSIAANLTISLLSMAYGFFIDAARCHSARIKGRRHWLFLSVLVHLSWVVLNLGLCVSTQDLGPARWLGPLLLLLIGVVGYHTVHYRKGYEELWVTLLGVAVMGPINAVVDTLLNINQERVLRMDTSESLGLPALASRRLELALHTRAFPAMRRVVLASLAALLYRHEPSAARLFLLIGFCLADCLAARVIFDVIGDGGLGSFTSTASSYLLMQVRDRRREAQERLRSVANPGAVLGAMVAALVKLALCCFDRPAVQPAVAPPPSTVARRVDGRQRAAQQGWDALHDMLELVMMQCDAAARRNEAAAHDAEGLGARLRTCCNELLDCLPERPADTRAFLDEALRCYIPSDDGSTERRLLGAIEPCLDDGYAPRQSPPQMEGVRAQNSPPARPSRRSSALGEAAAAVVRKSAGVRALAHPMRAVPLADALQRSLWTAVPSFFGRRPLHTAYDLSRPARHCDWFVSHAWVDDGRRKVAMLRDHLMLHELLGTLFVSSRAVLALFLLPLGLAVQAQVPGFPSWLPSAAVGAALLLAVAWVGASCVGGCVPAAATPWALSQRTVWLDKCCIDQSSAASIKAGVDSFGGFLDRCDSMIAFVSPAYFSRLWTLFELATFCRRLLDEGERTEKEDTEDGEYQEGSGEESDDEDSDDSDDSDDASNSSSPSPSLSPSSPKRSSSSTASSSRNLIDERLLLLSLDWPSALSPFKQAELTEAELAPLRSFSCLDAMCFLPSDRPKVLSEIEHTFGSHEAFDAFVREELPDLLRKSKVRYCGRLATVAASSLEMLLGA